MQAPTRLILMLAASAVMACGSTGERVPPKKPAPMAQETTPVAQETTPPAAQETTPPAAQETPVAVPVAAQPPPHAPAAEPAPAQPAVSSPAPQAKAGPTGTDKKKVAVSVLGPQGAQSGGTLGALTSTEAAGGLGAVFENPAATVQLHVLSATGAFDAAATATVMEMAHDHFAECGRRDDPNKPLKTGTPFKLKFRIGPKGTTSSVALTGAGKAASKCVVKIVRNLQFQPSKKATKVSATLTFERSNNEFYGMGGLGLKGSGVGGGGTGHGTIGLGSYGTIGHGSGSGSGYGRGSGLGRGNPPPQIRVGNAVTIGNLDKNIIRRFIRRSLSRIRYCYEKQLLLKPKLAGTVTVTFEIGTDGSVSRVDAKGITPAVSQCVGKTVGAIRFPKPQGGGVVSVRYPFSFSPSK